MTRKECEVKLLDLIAEARKVLREYDPRIEVCCLCMGHTPELDHVFEFTAEALEKMRADEDYVLGDDDFALNLLRYQIGRAGQ
ncbi:MAG: hypothetical protein J6P40_07340 [Oscillospiraceae bacterium]|nr:hypothetical protein [Oscillospiraceae bacterium]